MERFVCINRSCRIYMALTRERIVWRRIFKSRVNKRRDTKKIWPSWMRNLTQWGASWMGLSLSQVDWSDKIRIWKREWRHWRWILSRWLGIVLGWWIKIFSSSSSSKSKVGRKRREYRFMAAISKNKYREGIDRLLRL